MEELPTDLRPGTGEGITIRKILADRFIENAEKKIAPSGRDLRRIGKENRPIRIMTAVPVH